MSKIKDFNWHYIQEYNAHVWKVYYDAEFNLLLVTDSINVDEYDIEGTVYFIGYL